MSVPAGATAYSKCNDRGEEGMSVSVLPVGSVQMDKVDCNFSSGN